MVAKQTQLELIRDLVHRHEHELAAEVGELQRLKSAADDALNTLDTYLAEYTRGTPVDMPNTGRIVSQVDNERRFVKRLAQAAEQQRQRAQQYAEHVAVKKMYWRRERAHLDALERVVTQRRKAAGYLQSRGEQLEADALVSRAMALNFSPGEV